MPRIIVAGEAGSVHRNETDRIVYQLLVSWHNSCSVCIQYDHQIGPVWPIPFHRGCNCRNLPLSPGMESQPFVDYREKILEVSPQQQAAIMGRSNLALVESGVVEWSDVVTSGRIRSLREVVSRKGLTTAQMVRGGVSPRLAREAFDAVNTASHTASEARRKQLGDALLAKGYTRADIIDAGGRKLASRLAISSGPSGPSTIPADIPAIKPINSIPPPMARIAALKGPPSTASRVARLLVDRASSRIKFGSKEDLRNFLSALVRLLKADHGYDYRGPDDER